jgi:N-acyl homoserine lactone hydrolase
VFGWILFHERYAAVFAGKLGLRGRWRDQDPYSPGHTPAHVSVVVVDGEMSYFLAGDTFYTQRLLVEQHVDGISPDEATARQTMQKVLRYAQETPTVYLPTHDPDSGRRLEDGATLLPTG